LTLARSIGDHEGEGGALLNQGHGYLKQKKFKRAESAFNAALALGKDLGHKELEASACSAQAQLLLERDESQKALICSRKAIDLLTSIDVMEEEVFLLAHFRVCEAKRFGTRGMWGHRTSPRTGAKMRFGHPRRHLPKQLPS